MGERFIVEGETCFVTLLVGMKTQQRVGLILHGESAMEEFCDEAVDAFRELLENKRRKKRFKRIMEESEPPAKRRRKSA